MRILLLTSNSIQNFALSHKIASKHDLVGIVYENRFNRGSRIKNYLKKNNYNPIKIFNKIVEKIVLKDIDNSFSDYASEKYKSFNSFYPVPKQEVYNINEPATIEFIKNIECDLILVSGTQIVKSKVLSLAPKYGIINMHTGLSPYYNGGPSCTFWCLYNEDLNYIGSTVMFIDNGIDTGNIILSDTVKISGDDNYGTLEFKAIELGHELILKASKKIELNPDFKGYQQSSIASGYLYFNKDFTFKKRKEVQRKIKEGFIKKNLMKDPARPNPKCFPE